MRVEDDLPATRAYVCGSLCLEHREAVLFEGSIPGPQAELILAMLAVDRDGPTPRDVIADSLWPRALPRAWESSLRAVVARLRGAIRELDPGLAAAIVADADGYRLALGEEELWVDFHEAVRSTHAAEAALADDPSASAAAAWVGAAIAGRDLLPNADGPWPDAQRHRLRAVRLRALDCLSAALSRLDDHSDAIRHAELALALDPFRESAHRRLITAHAAAGDRGSAARAFERCSEVLARELGISPSPQTSAAYRGAVGLSPVDSGDMVTGPARQVSP